jgi:hypothetical protein
MKHPNIIIVSFETKFRQAGVLRSFLASRKFDAVLLLCGALATSLQKGHRIGQDACTRPCSSLRAKNYGNLILELGSS